MTERKRLPEVETFYGQDGEHRTPYLTRVSLGRNFCLHIFHRGDGDPDPHDHKRAFVTFPLTSYVEEVYRHGEAEGRHELRIVRAWRPHFRGRRFIHRVIGRWTGGRTHHTGAPDPATDDGQIVTLVWWLGRPRETWGFWCWPKAGLWSRRYFVEWRDYVYGGVRRHG